MESEKKKKMQFLQSLTSLKRAVECTLFRLKGIVHFEIHFWYVLAYLKGNQDVGVFVSTAFSILIFLGQTVPLSVI